MGVHTHCEFAYPCNTIHAPIPPACGGLPPLRRGRDYGFASCDGTTCGVFESPTQPRRGRDNLAHGETMGEWRHTHCASAYPCNTKPAPIPSACGGLPPLRGGRDHGFALGAASNDTFVSCVSRTWKTGGPATRPASCAMNPPCRPSISNHPRGAGFRVLRVRAGVWEG